MRTIRTLLVAGALYGAAWDTRATGGLSAGLERFYIGTYTAAASKGIYLSSLDLGAATFGVTNLAATASDPSFLAMHPNSQFVYALSEGGNYVAAYSVDPTTKNLTYLNQLFLYNGAGPCHVVVDGAGKNVLVANYGGGSVTVLSIQSNGRLGRQTANIQHVGTGASPLVHCVTLDASNHFALVCDKGLDRIYSYHFDSQQGTLTTNNPPWTSVAAGAGPRHLVFEPQYRRAYAICESSSCVIGFNYDSQSGVLTPFQTNSTLPAGWSGQNTAAEIVVHPSGKYVYGSNRGHNSIVVYSANPTNGVLALVQHQTTGLTPRNFAIEPTGAYCLVANQDSDTVVLYAVDPQTGMLTQTSQTLHVSQPVCIVPFFVQPPQPVLGISPAANNTLDIGIGNGVGTLTYTLSEAAALATTNTTWNLLMTGARGQTKFTLTNNISNGFLRAGVVTNY